MTNSHGLSRETQLVQSVKLWNGTSMSAGYASGAAALFLEIAPKATPDEVGEFLRRSATPGVIRNAGGEAGRLLYVGVPGHPTRTVALNGRSR